MKRWSATKRLCLQKEQMGARWLPGFMLALILLPACALAPAMRMAPSPEVERSISAKSVHQPIIVIPGFQGSTLRDEETGQRVWGAFAGDYARPDQPAGMRMMALPMQEGARLSSLHDAVIADGLLTRFQFNLLRLLPIYLDGYNSLINALEAEGYRFEPPGSMPDSSRCYDAFVFTYDWRRDNAENARRLYAFVNAKRAQLQRQGCYSSKTGSR